MTGYERGFESVREERVADLPVEGALPDWLSGSLIRNGPGRFAGEDGEWAVDHWFDGLAMLRKFTFREGAVRYRNRFLDSEAARAARAGRPMAGFGSAAGGSLWRRLRRAVVPEATDNANVNVARIGGRYVALTETPRALAFDPATVATTGRTENRREPSGHLTTAHPHYDADRGETLNYLTRFGATSEYRVYRVPDERGRRELVGRVPVDRPAYMHSFALTPGYVVLVEFPLVVDPKRILLPTRAESFIDNYEWRPARGTRFTVLDRRTGEVVARPRTDACFAFHHVNAFERDGGLVLDLVAFDDPSAIDALYLDELRDGEGAGSGDGFEPPAGALRRFRVDDSWRVRSETVADDGLSLPRYDERRHGSAYRYVYGQGTATNLPESFADRLRKVDAETGAVAEWREPDWYPGEPVFVPRPGGEEDEGVVLSVALDAAADRSVLVVLDAATMTERARAPLPHVLPFDFHGQFFPEVD